MLDCNDMKSQEKLRESTRFWSHSNADKIEAHDIMSRNIFSLQQDQYMCERIGPFDYIRDMTISLKGIRYVYLICGLGNKFKFLGVNDYGFNSLHLSEFT